jgi:hypothetical protein
MKEQKCQPSGIRFLRYPELWGGYNDWYGENKTILELATPYVFIPDPRSISCLKY